jgi:carboxymethylenebutenolidase
MVRSASGPKFGCYLVAPDGGPSVPAVVLASTVRGVDADLRGIADRFAARGSIAAAPDLFWRTTAGPLARSDPRAAARAQPRIEKIETGEQDLVDVLQDLRRHPLFDGRAAVIGFCYGGPYAILGPKRLGYHAGMSCHGSAMLDYVTEIEGVERPVCLVWGDQDHLAPAAVRDAYRAVSTRMPNVALAVLPGVQHGYMMQGNAVAFDRAAYEFSFERALTLLQSM